MRLYGAYKLRQKQDAFAADSRKECEQKCYAVRSCYSSYLCDERPSERRHRKSSPRIREKTCRFYPFIHRVHRCEPENAERNKKTAASAVFCENLGRRTS